jgi:tetraacyldisaccharide 4'-kinase
MIFRRLKRALIQYYIDVAENRRWDVLSILLKIVLWLLSLIYGIIVRFRNAFYTIGLIKSNSFRIPIVSLGNLTWGGSFKTSLAVFLVRRLQPLRIAVLVRGYGADEVSMLEEALRNTSAAVHVGKDRSAVLERIQDEYDLVLLDDGFQHRKVRRDLDIVMMNARNPFSSRALIPCGSLREPVSGIKRADMILFTNTETVPDDLTASIRRKNKRCLLLCAYYKPRCFIDLKGSEHSLETIVAEDSACFCAIAYPRGFLSTLHGLNIVPRFTFIYPDHYLLSEAEFRRIEGKCAAAGVHQLIITAKDKSRFRYPSVLKIVILDVDVIVPESERLIAVVREVVERRSSQKLVECADVLPAQMPEEPDHKV